MKLFFLIFFAFSTTSIKFIRKKQLGIVIAKVFPPYTGLFLKITTA